MIRWNSKCGKVICTRKSQLNCSQKSQTACYGCCCTSIQLLYKQRCRGAPHVRRYLLFIIFFFFISMWIFIRNHHQNGNDYTQITSTHNQLSVAHLSHTHNDAGPKSKTFILCIEWDRTFMKSSKHKQYTEKKTN